MKVLSLYDGMSCGHIALNECGLTVSEYNAFEIDKYAKQVSLHNFPNVKQFGDVTTADFTQFKDIDFLMGGSPCFETGTMVYTKLGYKPIEEIEVGDFVLTHKNRFRKVTAIGNKESDIYELSACSMLKTGVTKNHPYFTRNKTKIYNKKTRGMVKSLEETKWLKVEELKTKETQLGINKIKDETDIPELNNELCWLLGRYVADGHCNITKRKERLDSYQYQYQVIISVGDKKIDYFKTKIKDLHFSCYKHTKSTYRCVFSNMELCNLIKELDLGDCAINKNIPTKILNLPIDKLKIFLEGYYSGDGNTSKNTIICTTVSLKLVLSLQLAVLKVYGTNASISVPKIPKQKVIDGRIVNQKKQYVISIKKTKKHSTQGYLMDGQMWIPFKNIEYKNKGIVYNISVDEDESYTANNAIVHNCTYWSIAQTKNRETTASGIGWELFSHYVRALNESKPKYFIYENNKSMSKKIRKCIDDAFGFEAIHINSALVSAQNRNRLYWVGRLNDKNEYEKVNVKQPDDMGILLKDILIANNTSENYTLATDENNNNYLVNTSFPITEKRNNKIEKIAEKYEEFPEMFNMYNKSIIKDKAPTQTAHARCPDSSSNILRFSEVKLGLPEDLSSNDKAYTLTTRYDGAVAWNTLERHQRNMVAQKIINTLKPERVGIMPLSTGEMKDSQSNRIYTDEGKARTILANSGGGGGKTGLYSIPNEKGYVVKNGFITIKEKQYPIKLTDGIYIIRKLSVDECKRLQTVPDWYDMSVISKSQAYKCLGNGWTINVIKHLIQSCLKSKNRKSFF